MCKYKVGDRLQVKLSGGRIVEATIRAIVETTEGVRLQVSFGNETAFGKSWRIVNEAARRSRLGATRPARRERGL